MRATVPAAPLTLAAFLDWGKRHPERFGLVGGVVRMMAGGTEDHDRIGGNVFAALRARLRGTPCSAQGSNLKVLSRATGASMYPDVFVRCGPRDGGRTAQHDGDSEAAGALLSEKPVECGLRSAGPAVHQQRVSPRRA